MAVEVHEWDEPTNGPLTEDAVRAIHIPRNRHRVSRHQYPAGARFTGAQRATSVYVLEGRFRYTMKGASVELRAGQVAHVPEGGFEVEVIGDVDVVWVSAWLLPVELWPAD